MSANAEALVAVPRELVAVLHVHQHDPETCGREALRLLRTAGVSWRDLLGDPLDCSDFPTTLRVYSYRAAPPAHFARVVSTLIHLATPAELAEAAVYASLSTTALEEFEPLIRLAHRLLDARAAQLGGAVVGAAPSRGTQHLGAQ